MSAASSSCCFTYVKLNSLAASNSRIVARCSAAVWPPILCQAYFRTARIPSRAVCFSHFFVPPYEARKKCEEHSIHAVVTQCNRVIIEWIVERSTAASTPLQAPNPSPKRTSSILTSSSSSSRRRQYSLMSARTLGMLTLSSKTPPVPTFRLSPLRTLSMASNATGSCGNDTRAKTFRQETVNNSLVVCTYTAVEAIEKSLQLKSLLLAKLKDSTTYQKPVSLQEVCGTRQVDPDVHRHGEPQLLHELLVDAIRPNTCKVFSQRPGRLGPGLLGRSELVDDELQSLPDEQQNLVPRKPRAPAVGNRLRR